MIDVAVLGATGNMGMEVVKAVTEDPELTLAGCVDASARGSRRTPEHPTCGIPVLDDVTRLDPSKMDVVVDFTVADAAVANMMWALDNGVHAVVGTTGISEQAMRQIKLKAEGGRANVLIAANFAIGAVMMMRFAEIAATVFDQCEVIEYHHRGKRDAPSGTAIATAVRVERAMNSVPVPRAEQREITGTRGGKLGSVTIHSVRLDGFVAHQEVIFGAKGQTLSIRHDSTDRTCFMPGVVMAVKAIAELPGLTIGLDSLL